MLIKIKKLLNLATQKKFSYLIFLCFSFIPLSYINHCFPLVIVLVGLFILSTTQHLILVIVLAFMQASLYKFNPLVSRSTWDYLTYLLMTCLLHYLAIVINKNRSQHEHTRQENNTLELKQEKLLNTLAFVHEIRQPLSCLLMESQLLHLKSSKWQIPDEEKIMIDHLHERSKEIINTIKSIESLAMDSRNKKKPIDLSQVVLAAIKYNESTIISNSIDLSFNQDNFPYIISGDHYQLLILVRNVLTNSINSVVENQHLERSIKNKYHVFTRLHLFGHC